YKPHLSLERTIQHIDKFNRFIKENDEIYLIKNYEDINYIMTNDKIGVILSLEGAEAIFDKSALRILYEIGIRMISLTWNQRNQLADGIGESAANGGLTILGRRIVDEMIKLNIIVDVSHLSLAGFQDIVNMDIPFIASHSNAKEICNHRRNLDKQQILSIKNRKGLIGINFAPHFLNSNKMANISDVIRHINYIRGLIGIDYIVLGTDFDGINKTPVGLENISKLNNLKSQLLNNNYTFLEVNKIYYKNWLRFLKKYWQKY
ncbi:MAG: dipeptidase, partial [Bacillota bacterium]